MHTKVTRLGSMLVIAILVAITTTPAFAAGPNQQTDQSIVDIAIADGRFTTLVAALEAAELADTLSGDGPFTVFAPTDDAFAALPEGTVESLLNDIPTLTNNLLYHVVSGKVLAADVVKLSKADTLLGKPIHISVDGTTVRVNDTQVIITDIEASNGVIHVIDAVLLPPAKMADNYSQTPSTKYHGRHGYQGQRYSGPRYYNHNHYGNNHNRPGDYARNYYHRGYRGHNPGGQHRFWCGNGGY